MLVLKKSAFENLKKVLTKNKCYEGCYIRLENLLISILKWWLPILLASSIFVGKAYSQCAEPTGLHNQILLQVLQRLVGTQCLMLITTVYRIGN